MASIGVAAVLATTAVILFASDATLVCQGDLRSRDRGLSMLLAGAVGNIVGTGSSGSTPPGT